MENLDIKEERSNDETCTKLPQTSSLCIFMHIYAKMSQMSYVDTKVQNDSK
jgi:hypothetical protein